MKAVMEYEIGDVMISQMNCKLLGLIYRLYLYYVDKKTAKIYADKIPNTFGKVFGLCYHDFIRKK